MLAMNWVKSCPSCGHDGFLSPFPDDIEYDNDVGAVLNKGTTQDLRGWDGGDLALVEWRVCRHCSLIFSAKRPDLTHADDWYSPLFRHFEKRSFDVDPLPSDYLNVQRQFCGELFDVLAENGVFEGVGSVIHFRCNAGFLLDEIRTKTGVREVYGLEYFDNQVKYAQELIGADRVRQIHNPEPSNPFDKSDFDLIILDHFLTHAHNPCGFLGQVQSLLRPGGKIVIFNEQDHEKSLAEGSRYPRGINFFHRQLYKHSDMIAFLQSRGLQCEQVRHPPQRKWASPFHSMLFVCRKGDSKPMPESSAEASVELMRNWLSMHRRNRQIRMITKPVRKLLRGIFRAA